MNIESFVIGILTVVVMIVAVTAVLGLLKAIRLSAEVLGLKQRLTDDERELSREINMIEKTLSNQINHIDDGMHRGMDEMYRQGTAYTDKRIDKLIDTYFDFEKFKKKNILKD